jgi:hypothetical protein
MSAPTSEGEAMQSYTAGDKVCWNTPQGPHTGTIVERRTHDSNLERQRLTASAEKPVYIVTCHATGARAAHPPEALQPVHTVTTEASAPPVTRTASRSAHG